jgi:hypothetical protein
VRGRAMQEVEFDYPDEMLRQIAKAKQALKQPADNDDETDIPRRVLCPKWIRRG